MIDIGFEVKNLAQLPEDDGGGAADVEGVPGAILGNFQTSVTEGEQTFVYSLYFIAENDGNTGASPLLP